MEAIFNFDDVILVIEENVFIFGEVKKHGLLFFFFLFFFFIFFFLAYSSKRATEIDRDEESSRETKRAIRDRKGTIYGKF